MVEGQRALAVGEPAEGDQPDEIVRTARQPARAGAEHEFPDDVLDGLQPADVPALELKVDGLHRARDVEHDLDGDPLAGDPRLGLPRLRPGQPGDHQAQAQSVEIRQPAARSRCASVTGSPLRSVTLEKTAAGRCLRTIAPPEHADAKGHEDQPEPENRIEMRSRKQPCYSCPPGSSLGVNRAGHRRPSATAAPGSRTRVPGRSPGRSGPRSGCCPAYLTRSADSRNSASRTDRSGGNDRTRPHVAQEFLGRLLGGPDPRRVLDVLADDAGQPQVEFLDQAARPGGPRRAGPPGPRWAISSGVCRRGSTGRRLRRRSTTTASDGEQDAARPAATSQADRDGLRHRPGVAPSARDWRGSGLRPRGPT